MLELIAEFVGGIVLAIIVLGIILWALQFILEPVRKLILGILYVGILFALPVFALWIAVALSAGFWEAGLPWVSVLIAGAFVALFAAWWRFGRAGYAQLFREFLKFLHSDILGLTNMAEKAGMDKSNLHTIYRHGSRHILCDGTGKHYIRFQDTGEIEPHFTTCDTWWDDCRWWEDQPKDGERVIHHKLRELTRRRRINREKRQIRRSVWLWKHYSDPEVVDVVICNNEQCRRLFMLPTDYPALLMDTRHSQLAVPRLFKRVWFHADIFVCTTPYKGYSFHYECLPQPLKELFR